MRKPRLFVLLLFPSLVVPGPASAQDEDVALDGALVEPSGELLFVTRTPRGTPRSDSEIEALRRLDRRGRLDSAGRVRLAHGLYARSRRHLVDELAALERAGEARDGVERARLRRVSETARAARIADGHAALRILSRVTEREGQVAVQALTLRRTLLDEEGRASEALEAARELVRVCGTCSAAADALVFIGDRRFAAIDLSGALEAYGRAAAIPGAPPVTVSYAHYKRAWCHYNLSDFDAALAAFDTARRVAATQGESGRALRRDAARDIVRVMARIRIPVADAHRRLARLDPDPATRVGLAERYAEALRGVGRIADADEFARAWERTRR